MSAKAKTTMPLETSAIAQILRALYPPSLLVHVGWGNGLGDLTQWTAWQVPHAFVIEAEESKLAACQARALALTQANGQTTPCWQTIHATLAAQGGEQSYHVASNPSESGLVPTESLQHAWPRLQTVANPTVLTRSLVEVWKDIDSQLPLAANAQSTWLIIDCLPAADILAEGVPVLQSVQVLCARSLLSNRALLCDQIRAAGWTEVGWSESQHPAFGHAWFTRDIALELDKATQRQAQLTAERDALTKAKEAETQAKDLALQERDAQAQAKAALQTQLESLEEAIADSREQLGINNQAQSDLQSQLGAITQAQAGLQSELDKATQRQAQLTAERDEQHEVAEQAFVQIQTLTQQRDLYLSQRDEFNHIRVEQQTQLEVLSQEIQSVEVEKNSLHDTHQDLIARIRLMEDEISRTEGQIELIKDLMLSDGRTA